LKTFYAPMRLGRISHRDAIYPSSELVPRQQIKKIQDFGQVGILKPFTAKVECGEKAQFRNILDNLARERKIVCLTS
jgi:hypothetical protein